MKQKKLHLKTMVSMFSLMLAISMNPVSPGPGTGNSDTIIPLPSIPSVEEEKPESDWNEGIQPFSDMDDPTIKAPA